MHSRLRCLSDLAVPARSWGLLRIVWLLVLLAGIAGNPGPSAAQGVSGAAGVVSDSSGASIAGVEVKLEKPAIGYSATTKTDERGQFEFRRVPPGTGYTLIFKKDSFKAVTLTDLTLAVTEVATHNITLEVGDVTQSIEVRVTEGATLNTTDASIGNDIDTKRIAELPSLFRTSAASLLTLAPGVVATSDNGGEADSQTGSVTGSRADQGNITLDGLDVNDETIGQAFTAVGSPPIDSISEVHITVGGPDADLGRSSGGQINLVTKSGSNNWHGSAHEYNRNTLFAANDFFNNKLGHKRPALNRNQFGGSLGGPIHKDKLFFFFNYEGRRDATSEQVNQLVPSDTLRSGQLKYVTNVTGPDGKPVIATTTMAQLQSIDPNHVGADQAFVAFLNSRYPRGNGGPGGDNLNTAGFQFVAPVHNRDNIYTGRLDYNLAQKHKLFGRLQEDRFSDDSVQFPPVFPTDPNPLISIIDHDRSWVVGETWTLSNNLINQAFVGLTRQVLDFPVRFAPTAPNSITTSLISNPFGEIRGQARNVAVPEIRDDLTYTHGRHNFSFGTDIKPIRVHSSNQADINFVGIGLGGSLLALDGSTRPTDISGDPVAQAEWDKGFPLLLGRFSQTSAFFAYDKSGTALPSYTTTKRDFHFNEYEFYAQDSWRVRSDLTITYGLRWQYHSVPFEANGLQSVSSGNISTIFSARVAAAAQGISGNDAAPLVSYDLGGSANHKPGYYHPSYRDFGPRVGIAYSPAFTNGLLGALFGDHKTTVRLGGGIVYDRVLSTLGFELDQQTFLFDSNPITNYGNSGDPTTDLMTSPRFTALNAPPGPPAPLAVTPRPITPNIDNTGAPVGLANGGFPSFLQFDKNFKTPYSYTISFGVQRELPGKVVVEVNYFGRMGRKLTADGDAAQTLNFKDAASGQFLNDAFAKLEAQVQAHTPLAAITPQPWFENQMTAAGFPCSPRCTRIVARSFGNFVAVGDLSSTILELAHFGILNPNVALYAQTGANGYIGNYSSSSYNGMLMSVRKHYANNLLVDFDYSYSHSIDNQSNITNLLNQFTFSGQGVICDLTDLRKCRADSLFDARHIISANYVYDLPVGRGKRLLGAANGFTNTVLGGWATSGIVRYRTGFPFSTHTGTFPINFTQDAPAVFNGDRHAVRTGIHTDPATGAIQFFADQTAALGAFSFPFGGDTGTRNPIHGPGFATVDFAVFKNFNMPWSERQKLQFRWEAFNLFNHTNFAVPGDPNLLTNSNNILNSPNSFGVITQTASSPRQMQFSLRYDF
ncbi:MAG TPA: TonB-dependent receptor [Candidatus Acidoferrum sp.]|nr:TonB-dependent receptor [Candidatus Acidoferrum sp.]